MERTLRIAQPARQLIVNADDLGIGRERDAGILELFARRAITSASLLVTGASAASAAAEAVAAGLPLGLHLNLSEGRLAAASSLTDAEGCLLGKFGVRSALAAGTVADDDIAGEIRRQFEAFIALTGELPSHVDGHHHIHVDARVAAVLAPIMAREYGVYRVRLPRQHGLDGLAGDADFDPGFQQAVRAAAEGAAPLFAAHGIHGTKAFLGQSFMGRRLQAAALGAALQALADAADSAAPLTAELMVHPGYPAREGDSDAFGRSPARAHELAVLQGEPWRHAIAGWAPISFRELARPRGRGDRGHSRPTLLIYGKLTPATGNAETARRYAAAWEDIADIRFRPLPAAPDSPQAMTRQTARECMRLQEMARQEALDFAFGIHLYRAGQPLDMAFSGAFADIRSGIRPDAVSAFEAPPLPFALLASGTDANADLAVPERRAAMVSALAHADFLVCLNEEQKERLQPLGLPDEVLVQPNGIDVATSSRHSLRQALGLAADAVPVLFPAGLRRLKGILPTLEALADSLARRFPTHVLVLLGPVLEAGYAAEIRQRIDSLTAAAPALRGRIVLHPGLPRDDYLAALREAALVINASEHEGLSHALAEAMAAGVPVLARDIPGNRLLVRDSENGRLFADFAHLPAVYAACFESPEATARLAGQARADIAREYPVAGERHALRRMLERSLQRRQTALSFADGSCLRLDLAAGTHPLSADNLALFRRMSLSPTAATQLPATLDLAIDVGCGCGAFGLLLLDLLASHGRRLQRMIFSDPHRPSLDALARTLTRHAADLPALEAATLSDGSLLAPLLTQNARATLICANLPQTPGPAAFRADRHGGSDGADLLCALIAQLPAALASNGEAFLTHLELANPSRVAAALAANGLQATTIAEQVRQVPATDYEALQPGLVAWLLAERQAGRAQFTLDDGLMTFRMRLLRVRHAC